MIELIIRSREELRDIVIRELKEGTIISFDLKEEEVDDPDGEDAEDQ